MPVYPISNVASALELPPSAHVALAVAVALLQCVSTIHIHRYSSVLEVRSVMSGLFKTPLWKCASAQSYTIVNCTLAPSSPLMHTCPIPPFTPTAHVNTIDRAGGRCITCSICTTLIPTSAMAQSNPMVASLRRSIASLSIDDDVTLITRCLVLG